MPADAIALPKPARPGKLARIAVRLRDRGVAATLGKLFADHVFHRSSSVVLEYRPGWGEAGANRVHPAWLSFMVVRDAADLPPLCAWMARRRADFIAMLDSGKIGLLALDHGVVAGCVWVALTDHRDPASRESYAVGPREAYHYCWLSDPVLRHRNIGLPLGRFVMRTLADLGVTRQFGVVDRANRASYLIQTYVGYRECGVEVRHYIVFGTRWTRVVRYEGTLGPTRGAPAPRRAR